jgi:uncharacterized protein
MMNALSAIRCLYFLCCIIGFSTAYAANDKAFLWEVKSAADNASESPVVYLMGSIHFADRSFYPLRAEIEQAYDSSQYLVVELDINKTDHQAYASLLSEKGIYKDGTTIEDVISKETWLQLRQQLRHLNIDYDSVKNYKPGILVLTLSSAQAMRMGLDPELGLDSYFLARASQADSGKQIIELETLDEQLNLFLQIPDAELLLQESLYSLDESEQMMADMVHYWKQGDERQMRRLLFDDALEQHPVFSDIYDSLFYDRNDNMVNKITAMLQQPKGSYFVIVGSGHLIGDKGIVHALQEKGYRVRRL